LETLAKTAMLLAAILLSFTAQCFHSVACSEIDMVSTVVSVYDGDTFTLATGDKVRLADINAPEVGEKGSIEARDYLSSLVRQKTVYLDIDDMNRTDKYGRLVCVVYVDYNSTHYLNVNKALIDGGYAEIKDYPNEFDPRSFVLYLPKAIADHPGAASPLPEPVFAVTVAALVIGLLAAFLRRR